MPSKKDLLNRTPRPRERKQFLEHGPGHDNPAPPAAASSSSPATRRAKIAVYLPPDLHRRLKVDCAVRGTTIQAVALAAIEREFAEREDPNAAIRPVPRPRSR